MSGREPLESETLEVTVVLKAVVLGCAPGLDSKAVAEDIASFGLAVLGETSLL